MMLVHPEAAAQIVTILPQFRTEAIAKLTKLAKRAARYGGTIKWTIETTFDEVTQVRIDGRKIKKKVERCHFHVTGDAPRCGDFKFVAQLERTSGGVIISGGEVGKIGRRWDGECQHCGQNRARTMGYVVENGKGKRKIVGKSCLRDHLGMDVPAGALNVFKYLREIGEDEELGGWGCSRWEDSTRAVISAARVAIALYGWAPSSRDDRSTATDVSLALSSRWPDDKWAQDRKREMIAELKDRTDYYEGLADKVIAWGRKLKPRGDYEHNLTVALAADSVSGSRWGLVVSAAAAYDRQVAREAEEKAQRAAMPVSKHFGEIGVRAKGIAVEVIRVVSLPDNGWGESQIFVMRAEGGEVLSWKTASYPRVGRKPIEQGDKLKIAFTPKAHTEFKEVAETRVTRCTMEAI